MQTAFLKMHGAGNRILVVDRRNDGSEPPRPATIRRLADEATGPGFDQLMWVVSDDDDRVQAGYRVFNADGSEVEQCGNGVRCVAWMLARDSERREFRLSSPAGPVEARVVGPERVAVNMGEPVFEPEKVPFVAEQAAISYELDVKGEIFEVAVLSMGNPHCVLEVADVGSAPVGVLGAAIERHARFPARTNVGFMHMRDRGTIDLRVFERGVGETLACGTGACAAVVAARRRGQVDDEVAVNLPGGQLMVSWRGPRGPVWLTGNVELQREGQIEL